MFQFNTPEDAIECRTLEEIPFWYPCCQIRERETPVGDIDDLAVTRLVRPVETPDWLQEMAIDRTEMYLPGEIYKKNGKEPIRKLSEMSRCGSWEPQEEFYNAFDPSSLPPITYPLYNEVCHRQSVPNIQQPQSNYSTQFENNENEGTPCCVCNLRNISEHIHVPGANPCCLRNIVDKK